jgi:hypothetical protein
MQGQHLNYNTVIVHRLCSKNGIFGNWKLAEKPVDDKPTFQDLAENRDVPIYG